MRSSHSYFQLKAPGYLSECTQGYRLHLKEREWKIVSKFIGEVSGLKVMDLGCGPGWYSQKLKQLNPSLICSVDQSENMINEIIDENHVKIVADIETLKLEQKFDLVLCLGVLEFVQNPELALQNALNHLTPNGKLILLLPVNSINGKIYHLIHRLNGLSINLFTSERLIRVASGKGFELKGFEQNLGFNAVFKFEKTV